MIVCALLLLWKQRFAVRLYRTEHTQTGYTHRFDECQEDLEELCLEELHEERIRRTKWRLPILRTSNHDYCRLLGSQPKPPALENIERSGAVFKNKRSGVYRYIPFSTPPASPLLHLVLVWFGFCCGTILGTGSRKPHLAGGWIIHETLDSS